MRLPRPEHKRGAPGVGGLMVVGFGLQIFRGLGFRI